MATPTEQDAAIVVDEVIVAAVAAEAAVAAVFEPPLLPQSIGAPRHQAQELPRPCNATERHFTGVIIAAAGPPLTAPLDTPTALPCGPILALRQPMFVPSQLPAPESPWIPLLGMLRLKTSPPLGFLCRSLCSSSSSLAGPWDRPLPLPSLPPSATG